MQKHLREKLVRPSLLSDITEFLFLQPDNEAITIVDRVVVIVSRLSVLLILLGVAITFFEVVMRYVFNSPTTWAYKKTLWLGAIIYLISGAYAMQQRSHIRITAIYNIAPTWLRMTFDYLTLFVIVVYATLMLVGGIEPANAAFSQWIRTGSLLDPSIAGTIKPLVLIMTVVVVVIAINNLLKDHCALGRIRNTSNTASSNRDSS